MTATSHLTPPLLIRILMNQSTTFPQIPIELWLQIGTYLDRYAIARLSSTSRYLRQAFLHKLFQEISIFISLSIEKNSSFNRLRDSLNLKPRLLVWELVQKCNITHMQSRGSAQSADTVFPSLCQFPNLFHVQLKNIRLNYLGIRILRDLSSMQTLSLDGCNMESSNQQLPLSLRHLRINSSDSSRIPLWVDHNRMESIHTNEKYYNGIHLPEIPREAPLLNLSTLYLSSFSCPSLNMALVCATFLSKHSTPRLEYLSCGVCGSLSQNDLSQIRDHFKPKTPFQLQYFRGNISLAVIFTQGSAKLVHLDLFFRSDTVMEESEAKRNIQTLCSRFPELSKLTVHGGDFYKTLMAEFADFRCLKCLSVLDLSSNASS